MEQTLLGIVNAIVIYMYVHENSLENQEVVGLIFSQNFRKKFITLDSTVNIYRFIGETI